MDGFKIALWVIFLPLVIGVVVTIVVAAVRGAGNGVSGWKQSRDAQAAAKWDLLADELEDEGEEHDHR